MAYATAGAADHRRTKGDARRASVGHDLTWLINDNNVMVSTSQSATTFSR